jgi:cytochrome b pre-mRNA-processing protein 3
LAGFLGLFRRAPHERAGFELYTTAVRAAREPYLYENCGVPNTLDGRFDLICLHNFLVIHRLTREPEPGPALAQAVFDAMFTDMDVNLREMGVGDLSVSKKVKAMWNAFHGRSLVYAAALRENDAMALEIALVRNVWRGTPPPNGGGAMLARLTQAQLTLLLTQPLSEFLAGRVRFLPAAEAVR